MKDEKQINLKREIVEEIGTVKIIVEKTLSENEMARGDDNFLIKLVLDFCKKNNFKEPQIETITRVRRKLNENGLYLPNQTIVERRRKREKQFRLMAQENFL